MRPTLIARCGAIAFPTLLTLACSESVRSPVEPSPGALAVTAPAPSPTIPDPPTGVRIEFALEGARSEIRMTWNPISDATGYIVSLGRSAGGSDLGIFNVDATTFSIDALPAGRVFANVRAKNGEAIGAPSADVSEWFFDLGHYIEALFLGTGPLAPSDGNHGCSATGWVRGFAPGTEVPVLVSTTVSSDKAAAIHGVVNQVSQATAGVVRATYTETADPNPRPVRHQATSTTHPSPSTQGCGSDGGCTIHVFADNARPGEFISSRAVQPAGQTPEAYAHDAVGHGVLGLCHVDGNLIGGARRSMMSAGPGVYSGDIARSLSAYDLAAAQALYAAGLRPGNQRQDLVRAGLIDP
jgi:hypothetical protein